MSDYLSIIGCYGGRHIRLWNKNIPQYKTIGSKSLKTGDQTSIYKIHNVQKSGSVNLKIRKDTVNTNCVCLFAFFVYTYTYYVVCILVQSVPYWSVIFFSDTRILLIFWLNEDLYIAFVHFLKLNFNLEFCWSMRIWFLAKWEFLFNS